jgi:hypothetical protein
LDTAGGEPAKAFELLTVFEDEVKLEAVIEFA